MIESGFRPKSLGLYNIAYRPTIRVTNITFFYVFNVFLKIQKSDFLRFFALLHTFSQTMRPAMIIAYNVYTFSTKSVKTSTTSSFIAVVDSGTRISFLFARCRYLSIFRYFTTIN